MSQGVCFGAPEAHLGGKMKGSTLSARTLPEANNSKLGSEHKSLSCDDRKRSNLAVDLWPSSMNGKRTVRFPSACRAEMGSSSPNCLAEARASVFTPNCAKNFCREASESRESSFPR